jgi:hypothetical protein
VDLEIFLVSLYVQVDDRRQASRPPTGRGPGRPTSMSDAELLTLAILAQWPRWRGERDFWRFADTYLRSYFPCLLSQSRLNCRTRALKPELKAIQRHFAVTLSPMIPRSTTSWTPL